MANHKSAKKRARQNPVRRFRNRQYMSAVRTAVKQFQVAAQEGKSPELIQGLFVKAQSVLAKAASKGLLHHGNASRRIGRLAHALKNFGNPEVAKAAAPTKKSKASKAAKPKAAAPKKAPAAKKKDAAPKKKAAAKTTKKK